MNILVTGGDGQIGSELKKYAQSSKHQYYILNKKKLNITNFDQILKIILKNKISIIINTAAFTDVDKSEKYKKLSNNINNVALNNLIKISKKFKIYLIHLSTDYIFNGKKKKPYLETDKPSPINYYGLTKLKAEKKLINSNCLYLIFRLSSVYSKTHKGFMLSIINQAKKNKKFYVIDDYISSPTSAKSIARMLVEIIDRKLIFSEKIKCNIFNFSQIGHVSKYHFAKKIIKYLDLKSKCIPIKKNNFRAVKRPSYSVLNLNKFKSIIKIKINSIDYEIKNILL